MFLRLLDLLLHFQDLHQQDQSMVPRQRSIWGRYGGAWVYFDEKLFLLEVLDGELHGDTTWRAAR